MEEYIKHTELSEEEQIGKLRNSIGINKGEVNMDCTFIMVWIDESEKWYYFVDNFDSNQFPDGYVEYSICVKEGIITSDTFNESNVNVIFSECYDQNLWKVH